MSSIQHRKTGDGTDRWRAATDQLDMTPAPRIHDLRHTFASWAIQAGVPLPVIQRQLGHESIQTTVDTYGHLARSDFDPMIAAVSVNLTGVTAVGKG